MSPAEIIASLKELCVEEGPRIKTERIVRWIEQQGGFESDAELIAFAKKMKARQYARLVFFEDDETGLRLKRLWSFREGSTGDRYYHDIALLSPERRRSLIRQYARFLDQMRCVRRALNDYVAGQGFFDFYSLEPDLEEPRTAEVSSADVPF